MRIQHTRSNKRINSLGEIENTELAQVPITEFAHQVFEFPNFDANFPGEVIDPLSNFIPDAAGTVADRMSSFIASQTVEEPILVTSVGVVVVPDIRVYSLNGADILGPAAGVAQPEFTGFVPPAGIGGDAAARPAQFQYGHDTWEAAWALLNSYDLVFNITSRYQLFRELAANVGACAGGIPDGFGSALYSPVRDIRRANDLAKAQGITRQFFPQTVTAGTPNTPVAPPLVNVAYGGLQMGGVFGGWYNTNGILLMPGMPINVRLERTARDTIYHRRLEEAVRNSAQTFTTYSSGTTDLAGAVGFAGAKVWKAGVFRVGLLFRGFSLEPYACLQSYRNTAGYLDAARRMALYQPAQQSLIQYAGICAAASGGQMAAPNTLAGIDELELPGQGIVRQLAGG